MGHRHKSAPNRGSLGFRPRKRAKRESARWRNVPAWYQGDTPLLVGYPGYKVGMTHIVKVEEKVRDPHFKQEVLKAVTIVELPKTICFGIRAYKYDDAGVKKVLGEAWTVDVEKDFKRKLKPPSKEKKEEIEKKIEQLREKLSEACEVSLLLYTLPREAGLPKKTPDIIETSILGNNIENNFNFAVEKLGQPIKFSEIFKDGEFCDVTAVTKGKGFQGPVKRHGIKVLPRKKRKGRRVVGAIGAWHPARTPWTTPRAGQLGYHQRTEYNKKILKYSENPREINPKSGFKHYGVVKSPFILIEGSIPGPSKRLVRLRKPMRLPPEKAPKAEEIKISYISTSFRQKEVEQEEEL